VTFGVDPAANRQVGAAVLALRAADRSVQKISRDDTNREFRPVWIAEVRKRAVGGPGGRQRASLTRTGTGFSGGNPPEGWAYRNRRTRSGGLSADHARAYEFGATNPTRNTFRGKTNRSPRGRTFHVYRRTARQLPPFFRKEGYSVYPAVKIMAPRVVSFWVASVVRAYNQAFEGLST
jgi:hypothetical protein